MIIHVDMDAFFVEVERREDPALRGRPVAVCGRGKRTVVSSASYEARRYGVKAGMPLKEAKRLCPHLILIPARFSRYVETSRGIMALLYEFTPMIEPYSIDEAFLDVTGSSSLFGGVEGTAKAIKERIREVFELPCTVGVGPNKLVAKLAGSMAKPDGLKIVPPEEVARMMEALPVGELWGVGEKMAASLEAMGIRSCGQLSKLPPSLLRRRFGIWGEALRKMAQGVDETPVVPFWEARPSKSMGHSLTLDEDISDKGRLRWYLLLLSEQVGRRLREGGYRGRTVVLTIRYRDFQTFSRRMTLQGETNIGKEIYEAAWGILEGIRLREKVRLLGVSVTNLVKDSSQLPLFPEERRLERLASCCDQINAKYGDFALSWVPLVKGLQGEIPLERL